MDEQAIENAVMQKGLTAPRLTPDDIDALIVDEQYHHFEGTTVTVCCLRLRNGYCVVGESAAVSMENFDAEIGRGVARMEARNKIWALAGYALKQRLFEQARALLASAAEPAANAQGEVEATYPVVDELDQLAEHDARWEALTNDPYGEHYRTVKRDTEF